MEPTPDTGPADTGPADTGTGHREGPADHQERWLDRSIVAVLVLCAAPMVVALASAGQQHWYPTGDMAQAELHMRGFFGHPPLVGAAGRIGSFLVDWGQGSHPGPAMWFAMLPVYLLFGRSSFGLMVSVAVVQFAFLCLTVWLTRRLAGPRVALVTAVAAAALVHSLGPATYIEAWNPWLAVFAFFAFIAAAWGVLCGRHRWLWLAVFTGVFAVQCHAGYIPMVGAVLTLLAALTLWRWYRDRPTRYARWWWASVGVFVAMWLPPLIDQWRRNPGNLRILYHHFTSTTEFDGTPRNYVGLVNALKAFAGEFSVSGPWVRGPFRQPSESPNWITFLIAVALVALSIAALRRIDADHRRLLTRLFALLAVLISVGLLSTARIFGEFYDYVIRWWWLLVAWTAIAAVVVGVQRTIQRVGTTPQRRIAADRAIAVLAVLCAVVAGTFAIVDAADTQVPSARNSELSGGLADMAAEHLDTNGHYLVRWYDPASLGGIPFGVILELERQGFHVGVDAPASAAALPHRVMFEPDATEVLWVVVGQRAIDDFRARDDARELAVFDQRTPTEAQRSDALRTQLIDALTALGLECYVPTLDTQYGLAPLVIGPAPIPDDVRQIAIDYNRLGLPGAVFAVPIGAPGYMIETEGCD